jgi:hypothetical protein
MEAILWNIMRFPAFKVRAWIESNCKSKNRKKHLLSTLVAPMPGLSQGLYDYQESPEKDY